MIYTGLRRMKDWASRLLRKWSWASLMLSKSLVELICCSSWENWDSRTSTWRQTTGKLLAENVTLHLQMSFKVNMLKFLTYILISDRRLPAKTERAKICWHRSSNITYNPQLWMSLKVRGGGFQVLSVSVSVFLINWNHVILLLMVIILAYLV